MRTRHTDDGKGDTGFTLIELLVVMLIIGILAAIAIPVFLGERQNGWRSAVKSDLKNAAIGAQSWSTVTGNGSFAGLTDSVLKGQLDGVSTSGVTVTVVAAGLTGFCLQGTHVDLPGETYYYDSLKGAPGSTSCSGTAY